MPKNPKTISYDLSERLLTQEEEISLGNIICSTDPNSEEYKNAFSTMVESNLRLVLSEVNKISNKAGGNNSSNWDDLFSEGYLGLHKAVERFDPSKCNNCRFATYASYWIKQFIYLGINKSLIIKIPRNVYNDMSRYKELKDGSINEVQKDEAIERLKISDRDFENIMSADMKVVSIFEPVDEFSQTGNNTCISDLLEDKDTPSQESIVNSKDRVNLVKKLLLDFNQRDREIVMSYFEREDDQTLCSIGKKYRLSRERIRQIKNSILSKMKEKVIRMQVERSSE